MKVKVLPWMLCALVALFVVPALANGDSHATRENVDAAFVVFDNGFHEDGRPLDDNTVNITPGGRVTFSYPVGLQRPQCGLRGDPADVVRADRGRSRVHHRAGAAASGRRPEPGLGRLLPVPDHGRLHLPVRRASEHDRHGRGRHADAHPHAHRDADGHPDRDAHGDPDGHARPARASRRTTAPARPRTGGRTRRSRAPPTAASRSRPASASRSPTRPARTCTTCPSPRRRPRRRARRPRPRTGRRSSTPTTRRRSRTSSCRSVPAGRATACSRRPAPTASSARCTRTWPAR